MATAIPGIWRLVTVDGDDRRAAPARDLRRVVLQYALSGLAALILLAGAGVYLLRDVGRDEP